VRDGSRPKPADGERQLSGGPGVARRVRNHIGEHKAVRTCDKDWRAAPSFCCRRRPVFSAALNHGRIMVRTKKFAVAMLCVWASLLISCGKPDSGARNSKSTGKTDDEKILNFYNWSDYIAPDTIASFEKLTGIKVRASYFDSNEALESRMLTGNSGFDVVVPTGAFIQRQIRSGAYLPLDKKQLPNLANLDPAIMARAALYDPGNAHGVVYMRGTVGIGYNETLVAAALNNTPLNSWRLIFDPAFAAKFAKCGINMMDDPVAVVRVVLKYLGKNPNAPTPQDLADVETVLSKIRRYVRNIDTSGDIEALANGDVCIALAYNGDVVQARKRATEAKSGIKITYVVPEEGSLLWLDMLAIPRDAPHVSNAYLFVNYLMNPQVIANISNFIGFANANSAAGPLLNPSVATDDAIYPTRDQQQRLFLPLEPSAEQARAITRIWQKFKTGQ
jgi:putrescine transport system substrate-binding protein